MTSKKQREAAKRNIKKALAALRAKRGGKKVSKRKSYSSIKQKRRNMARKRYVRKKRSYRKSASILGVNTAKALGAMIYGGVRMRTSNMLAPYTSKIPLGNISDEVGMLAVTTLAKKYLFKRAGTLRDAMTAGQTIELARIGEAVASGNLGISIGGGNAENGNGNGYVFA